MSGMLSLPFRITPAGYAAVSDEGTLQFYAEQLTQLALTKTGERDLCPDFGVTDPTYQQLDVTELQAKAALFDLPLEISSVSETYDTKQKTYSPTIQFQVDDSGEETDDEDEGDQ